MKCANCGKNHSGGLCPWCGHVDQAPPPSEAQVASLTRRLEQRHGVPALLSFFVPGLGQFIKGNVSTALQVWFGTAVLVVIGLAGLWLTFLGIPILWGWSLYDAYTAPDGQARREMARIAKTMVVLMAIGLAGAGCGSVTAKGTEDDAGTGGAAGKIGVESGAAGAGGESSATGGSDQATGGSGGLAAGAGGTQATGGLTGTGGAPGCSGGQKLCGTTCVNTSADNSNCGSCGTVCSGGKVCTGGACVDGSTGTGGAATGGSSGSGGATAVPECGQNASVSGICEVYDSAGHRCDVCQWSPGLTPYPCITGSGSVICAQDCASCPR